MYAKRIIPCLDVNEGRVVKGTSFVNLRDAGDPVACAEAYDAQQADELVLLDITASAQARGTQLSYVQSVAERIFIPFTVGGGIRTVEDFTVLLRAGADKVSVNSAGAGRRSSPRRRKSSAASASSARSTRSAAPAAGACILTAAGATRASTPSNGRRKPSPSARAKSS